jgi:hypothetical protein
MALSNEQVKGYIKRLLLSRMRILANNGFYGLLLMHLKFALDEECETAYTDGERIAFNPTFMDELSDSELDFVLMHEILHVVLRHCAREGNRDHETFNIACDIVVNSNIKLSCNNDPKSITLKRWGVSMYLAPNGKEGHHYTAEEVYEMLSKSFMVDYDDAGSIGKRYRRQDGIGTPMCICYDFDSEQTNCVTVRDRDTMEQETVSIDQLEAYIANKIKF